VFREQWDQLITSTFLILTSGHLWKVATEDFDKSIELARGFERQARRANATIAIARSVLEEKKK